MSFFNVYFKRLVGGNVKIARTQILAGQIVSFNYGKGISRKIPRLVFVLNAKDVRKGTNQLHGINLEWVPWNRFRAFLKQVVVRDTLTLIKRKQEIRGPFDQIIDRPVAFYKKHVKPNVLRFECYRTYKVKNMANIRLWAIDYKTLFAPAAKQQIDELIGETDKISEIEKEVTMLNEIVDIDTSKLKESKYRDLVVSRFGSVKKFKDALSDIEEYIDETGDWT